VQGREGGLGEDLAHQAQILVHQDRVTVADSDPGRLLAAMLLGEQTEVGEARDVLARRPHAEQSALFLR
jgi:hypothetical protein